MALAGMLAVALFGLAIFYNASQQSTSAEITTASTINEYNSMLAEASAVIHQLREITVNKTVLPVSIRSPMHSTAAVSAKKSTDLILGMAQEIDPKNLAVFCGSLRRLVEMIKNIYSKNKTR